MLNKPVFSLNSIIAQLDSQFHWNGSAVTFAFDNTTVSNSLGDFSPFTQSQKVAAREAVGLWDDLIQVNLSEAAVSSADILFGNDATAGTAYAYFPPEGDVFVNPNDPSNSDLDHGEYGFQTLIHELGHALGLDHPGNYNAGDNDDLSYENHAEYVQDSLQYTAMSYWEALNTGANHGNNNYGSTPLLHDIAAIQAIYGANMTTRVGDTVYGFNSTADRDVYSFSTFSQTPILAIWDAGGSDTLDLSGYHQAANINLTAGSFSDVGGLTDNIAIAFNAEIENAIGGAGNDLLLGQHLANTLEGGGGDDQLQGQGGNDQLIGGLGQDTAVFSGSINQYSFSLLAQDSYQTVGVDGTDSLSGIELVRFDDTSTLNISDAMSLANITDTNNSFATAFSLTDDTVHASSIGAADTLDFYQYEVLADAQLNITLADFSQNMTINLYDSQQNLLLSTTDNATVLTHPIVSDKSYFISIANDNSLVNSYSLSLTTLAQDVQIQTQVLALTVGMFNAAAGAAYFNEFYNYLDNGGDADVLANTLAATSVFTGLYDSNLSDVAFSELLIENIVENEASAVDKAWASNWLATSLESGVTRASSIIDTIDVLQSIDASHAQWGNTYLAFNHKIAVAKWYSIENNTTSTSLAELQAVIEPVTSDPNSVTAITDSTVQTQANNSMIQVTGINAAINENDGGMIG